MRGDSLRGENAGDTFFVRLEGFSVRDVQRNFEIIHGYLRWKYGRTERLMADSRSATSRRRVRFRDRFRAPPRVSRGRQGEAAHEQLRPRVGKFDESERKFDIPNTFFYTFYIFSTFFAFFTFYTFYVFYTFGFVLRFLLFSRMFPPIQNSQFTKKSKSYLFPGAEK